MQIVLGTLVLISVSVAAKQDFAVNVNSDGSYNVVVQGDIWLKSVPTFFRADGKMYSLSDGSLKLVKNYNSSGQDNIGQWTANSFLYQAGSSQVETSFVQYTPDPRIFTYNNPSLPFMLFKQKYINGANNTSASSTDATISGFPGFMIEGASVRTGYLTMSGLMTGSMKLSAGEWGPKNVRANFGGLEAGPLAIFDREKTANTLIISSASEFMSSSIWRQDTSVYWGTMGGVGMVPSGFESYSILFCGNQGINKAFVSWGQILQTWYGRTDHYLKSDFTLNYLGYWTDNGAYYYRMTEPGKTFQDTVLDVVSNIKSQGIPVRYFQYDDWWYFVDNRHGIISWDAMPSVFPNGLKNSSWNFWKGRSFQSFAELDIKWYWKGRSFQIMPDLERWLFNKTNLPVLAHSMFWSSKNVYAKQNGGKYNFIMDGEKALPTEEQFWTDLMANARQWGLINYEQDFLNVQFEGISALNTDIHLGRQWLREMGNGAGKNDLTIQYCMSLPRHIMQSLEIPVVTQARASNDYHPSGDNWIIGETSLFAWAVGVAPSKDNFWTSSTESGRYGNTTEPNTELNALIATLSTGPVGPSDMVDALNKTLIMRSVNADGLILRPSRPATSIDNKIRRMAWKDFEGPQGEVWSTYSDFGGSNKYGIILAANQVDPYTMTPCMAGFQGFPNSMVFAARDPNHIQPLTDPQPLSMSGCTTVDFCLFYVSPVLKINGKQVLIQGELDKWVPMSPQRVTDISISDDIVISLTGAAYESVNFWFNVDGTSSSIMCTLGAGGVATLSFNQQRCRGE